MNRINRIIAVLLVLTHTGVFNLPVGARTNGNTKNASARPEINKSLSRVTPSTFDNPALVRQYQQTNSPETLASHLYLLASDLFEGRENGSRGQKLAAQYLASQYRLAGVAPRSTTSGF